jgi:hypothetical protein
MYHRERLNQHPGAARCSRRNILQSKRGANVGHGDVAIHPVFVLVASLGGCGPVAEVIAFSFIFS